MPLGPAPRTHLNLHARQQQLRQVLMAHVVGAPLHLQALRRQLLGGQAHDACMVGSAEGAALHAQQDRTRRRQRCRRGGREAGGQAHSARLPALRTSRWMALRPATAGCLANACTLFRSARSRGTTVILPGAGADLPAAAATAAAVARPVAMPSAASWPRDTEREHMMTSAPAPASTRTVSAPRPAGAAVWCGGGGGGGS